MIFCQQAASLFFDNQRTGHWQPHSICVYDGLAAAGEDLGLGERSERAHHKVVNGCGRLIENALT